MDEFFRLCFTGLDEHLSIIFKSDTLTNSSSPDESSPFRIFYDKFFHSNRLEKPWRGRKVYHGNAKRLTMKTNAPVIARWISVVLTAFGFVYCSFASETAKTWQYLLLPDSQLIERCPVCGRPEIPIQMEGKFRVREVMSTPILSVYSWEMIAWSAGGAGGPTYQITGHGTWQWGGEVAVSQDATLDVWIQTSAGAVHAYLTNVTPVVTRHWPMIYTSLEQTNGTLFQQFALTVAAAPAFDIWFSTSQPFHAGIWDWPTNRVSEGDLISSSGRIIKRNSELTGRLGIMPPAPDLGLDGIEARPGGDLYFSIKTPAFSETLGQLNAGDLLSDKGRVVSNYMAMLSAFAPTPPLPDPNLDALQIMANGEIFFSVGTDFFSERLGKLIRKGDLLSSAGRVVKTQEELVARFYPADPKTDYGLDAIHVWPSGEVWFSVETGFYGSHFEYYGPGYLLSDQGYIVARNLDLLAKFQPLEDLADFGLDALLIVTDADEPSPGIAPPRCTGINLQRPGSLLTLTWDMPGRLFQLEWSTNCFGPWTPLSPVITGLENGALTLPANAPRGFYRLKQW